MSDVGRMLATVGLSDGFGWDDTVSILAGVTAILTFFGVLLRPLIRRVSEFLDWSDKFREDWDGVPARTGHAAEPGVMERLNNIDGEFQRNGGATMKDTQFRIERKVDTLGARMSEGDRMRESILAVTSQNMRATEEAFRLAGLEPPRFEDLTGMMGHTSEEDPNG